MMILVINIMLQAKSVFWHYSEDFELEFLPCRLTTITEQSVCLQTNIYFLFSKKKNAMNIVAFYNKC